MTRPLGARRLGSRSLLLLLLVAGCGGDEGERAAGDPAGGSPGLGGTAPSGSGGNGGGASATGGAGTTGGAPAGGAAPSGGMSGGASTGGLVTGGTSAGGADASGGTQASGGAPAGGTPAGGAGSGGDPAGGAAGGATVAGGSPTGGFAAGGTTTGGAEASGGAAGSTAPQGGTSAGSGSNGGSPTGGTTAGGSASGGSETGGAGGANPADPVPCEAVPAGEQLAFPGAEGFGRLARGGRGGDVCHVTNLEDAGAGSFRDCVSAGDRTVVFDVGGWITLASGLGITADRLTIAGQTAPGGGIGLRGQKVSIGGSDVVVRFLRVRRGILVTEDRNDTLTVSSAASDVILDHCSVAFGTDENFSMPGDEAVGPREFTVQWSIVAYGLQRNNHSAGSLLTASDTTIHHSLYAFNKTRNPKARSEDGRPLDFVNNVIYGWNAPDPYGEANGWSISGQPFIMGDTSNGMHYANAVGNAFVSYGARSASQAFVSGGTSDAGAPTYNLYFEDNLLDGNANGVLDASKTDWSMVETATRLDQRLAAPQVCTDDVLTAYERVLSLAGASVPARDELEAGLVTSIRAQGGILVQDESDLGIGADGYGTLASGTAPADDDGDGMPDSWEWSTFGGTG
ncbi:MAG TPA: hypothetical protein PLU22_17990, partial [Polyangiaceae bacterium]|nr:hypothetical protein [Polyangiaceae bacterium]